MMNVINKVRYTVLLAISTVVVTTSSWAQTSVLDKTGGKTTTTGSWIAPKVEELPDMKMGPFVRLADGGILTVHKTKSLISQDEGKTWTEYPIFSDPEKFEISDERALIRTKKGAIILAFMNLKERSEWNWQKEIADWPGAILPTYAVRSLDGGKTWEKAQKLHDEWTGAIRDMIETKDGSVVFTSMMMLHNPGRHSVLTYTSKNEGKSWTRSTIIDLGGTGHHGGVTEATLEQLKDGRLWLLLRTNWGRFWEAYSKDDGINWSGFNPTKINASSAPGLIKRLQSGRLVLVWNTQFPQGRTEYKLSGGDNQWSEIAASNHRDELAIAFSDDEGKSWSKTVVIAEKGKQPRLSYPYVFEQKPGILWITTMQGELRVKLEEKNFLR
ncbi:BNR repeat protein [Larkinella arboricola]|uniref:BNR repeat protein n=1 Tax=Larkinella arboricola TaxID=643671 RepID=A0A327WVH3_LARAB|nr:sialidase family protein [Larkinella arboricola]RAJ93110.1 BNR repeat protein [Larkinella arboricola]